MSFHTFYSSPLYLTISTHISLLSKTSYHQSTIRRRTRNSGQKRTTTTTTTMNDVVEGERTRTGRRDEKKKHTHTRRSCREFWMSQRLCRSPRRCTNYEWTSEWIQPAPTTINPPSPFSLRRSFHPSTTLLAGFFIPLLERLFRGLVRSSTSLSLWHMLVLPPRRTPKNDVSDGLSILRFGFHELDDGLIKSALNVDYHSFARR